MKTVKFLFFFLFFSTLILPQSYKPEEKFDPTRDPNADLKVAIIDAKQNNKRIILDVGGEWCIWCHRIDDFMHTTPEVSMLLEKNYIVVKVNYSKENKNEKFLSNYPAIEGYPHFFVLEKDGKILHSQNTGDLEKDKGYDKDKFVVFLNKWAP